MRTFVENSARPMIWVIAILELLLFGFMIYRFVKTKSKLTLLTLLITFGLFYDAFIIALGGITSCTNFGFLNRLRFVSHGLLIPLLFTICSFALDLKKPWSIVLMSLTLVLMVLGLAEAIATKLGVVEVCNISRMSSIKGETPKWAELISRLLSFGTVIPMMGVGIYVIIKQKNPHLFLSGFLMFLFSAIGPATKSTYLIFYLSMYGEILMVIFLLLFAIKKEKRFL